MSALPESCLRRIANMLSLVRAQFGAFLTACRPSGARLAGDAASKGIRQIICDDALHDAFPPPTKVSSEKGSIKRYAHAAK